MRRPFWIAGFFCLGILGCMHGLGNINAPEDIEKEKDLAIRTIGDVTELANAGAWQLSGVGLVTGLEGTGHTPKGQFRDMLEKQLRQQQQIDGVQSLLTSP